MRNVKKMLTRSCGSGRSANAKNCVWPLEFV